MKHNQTAPIFIQTQILIQSNNQYQFPIKRCIINNFFKLDIQIKEVKDSKNKEISLNDYNFKTNTTKIQFQAKIKSKAQCRVFGYDVLMLDLNKKITKEIRNIQPNT